MKTLQVMREERDNLMSQAKTLSERENLTPEEDTTFDNLMTQVDELEKAIKATSRKEMLNTRENGKAPAVIVKGGKPEANDAFCAFIKGGRNLSSREGNAADHFGIDPRMDKLELRALQVGTDSEGGYLVPSSFTAQYEKKLAFVSPALQAMGQLPTNTGEAFPYPRVDDVSSVAEYQAEEAPIGVTPDPVFDTVSFPRAFDYYSPIVKVSNQLLRDAIIDIPGLLMNDLFPERHAKKMEALVFHATNDGVGEPEPVLYGVSAGVNLATGNAFTIAKLFDLESAMPVQYRANASFVMHDATWQKIRQITDDDLRPLLNIDLQAGLEKRLLGYPVILCNTMTSINSPGDNKPLILMADLSRYKVRRVASPIVTRFNELYQGNGQVGFMLSQAWDARWVGHKSVCAMTLNSYDSP